jgi:hypothetical protein
MKPNSPMILKIRFSFNFTSFGVKMYINRIVTVILCGCETWSQEVGWGRGDWMELTQDRDRWRALVGTVRNFRVS